MFALEVRMPGSTTMAPCLLTWTPATSRPRLRVFGARRVPFDPPHPRHRQHVLNAEDEEALRIPFFLREPRQALHPALAHYFELKG